ncbi:MAG: FxLD family lanthipeptide [Sciscionella sp.]
MSIEQVAHEPVHTASPEAADDGFDLQVRIVANDMRCVQSAGCDTSDGCSSTCPSACVSA